MKTERRVPEARISAVDADRAGTLADAMREALGRLPCDRLIRPTETVVIKPNLVCARAIPNCGTTDPELLRAVIREVRRFNPRRLVVTEGSGGTSTEEMVAQTWVDVVLREEGVEFVDLNDPPLAEYAIQHDRPPAVQMNRLVDEIDVLVSLAVLKMHEEATSLRR